MIGKKSVFFALLLLLSFFHLSAWVWPRSVASQSNERQRPMYLSGQVLLDDGQVPEERVTIELVCQGTVVRQEYTSNSGTFSVEISRGGSTKDKLQPVDASASASSYSPADGRANPSSRTETSVSATVQKRQMDLSACDLTARLTGYQTAALGLGRRKALDSSDVGVIVLHSLDGAGGGTISLKTLAAPKEAREAYEKAGQEVTKEKPNYSRMAKELEKAVEIYPEFAAAWQMLGDVRLAQKDRPAAGEAFEVAKAADPEYLNPYLSLALMELEEERWEEAADLCAQALELSPQHTRAHYLNALAHTSLGKFDVAEESALLVLEHNQAQTYPLIYYVLGFAEAQKGDFPSAAAHFRSFQEIQPNVALARKLGEQLAQWQQQGLIQ